MAAGGDEARAAADGEAAAWAAQQQAWAAQRQQWVVGMRLFAVVGLVFAGMYLVSPEGPWKWLSGAIAVVCLVRGMWYGVRARELGRSKGGR